MTGTMMMERTGMGMPGMGMPGMGMPGMAPTGMPGMGTAPMAPTMMTVPRCKMAMEKVQGGLKVTCTCDDATARAMMQNLCTMLAGSMCSCSCVMNGMMVCTCNLTMGLCKCDMTKDGCVVTCTSGDAGCAAMIQGCCDCMSACLKAGCTCCLMMGSIPVCAGTM